MAEGAGSFNGGNINNIEIEIDAAMIGAFLAKNPAFVNAIAIEVRSALLKDVRRMENLFANKAGKQLTNQTLPAPSTLNTNQGNRLT
jgi:hypothetical protein